MMGDLRDRAACAAQGVTYRAVQFGLEHPVAFAAGLIVALIFLVVYGVSLLSGVWRYLVWAAVIYIAYRLLATGVLQGAVDVMREDSRQYFWVGVVLIVAGLAFPFVVQPQTYVDAQVALSYKLTSAPGLLGFAEAVVDVNSLDSNVSIIRAYQGVPFLHVTKGVPEYSSSPGDGWWVCVREVTGQDQYPEYCWQIPGVNVFVRFVSGSVQSQGYYIESLPIHARRGYLVVSVYRDRVRVWDKGIQYVVEGSSQSSGGLDVSASGA